MVDELIVLEFGWRKSGKIIGFATETAAIGKILRNVIS